MNLPTLQSVLASHDDLTTVPALGFRAWISDGTQFLAPVVVTAVLDRTAVVHPFGHTDQRKAVRLDAVHVSATAIRWEPRNRHELKELESRQRARANRRGKDPSGESTSGRLSGSRGPTDCVRHDHRPPHFAPMAGG